MDSTSVETVTKIKGRLLVKTASVCPVCLARIPAERVAYGDEVYLEKTCPQHGFTRTILWRGFPEYGSWMRDKIPNHPAHPFSAVNKGCPFDCGLCADHRQQPCCVLLEVTQRCDLGCPVCFANSKEGTGTDTDMQTIELSYQRMLEAGGPFNIQLSGGEPCVRNDLPQVIEMGREMGFTYFQVNTNGLRIARDPAYLAQLKKSGLQVVYLQFDGTDDAIYERLRGRRILQEKLQAIHNCREAQLGVVLVPTIVPGVNAGDIGNIIRFALENYPVVRSIHFQPVSYFGRYPRLPENSDRITIPELLRAMEEQTDKIVHVEDFQPKGSENSYCSFHATYIIMADGVLKPIKAEAEQQCGCRKPDDAREAVAKSKDFVARNWVYSPPVEKKEPCCSPSMGEWDTLIERSRTHLFSISGMAFQDGWNLDLQLLQDCCIHIASTDGRLVPFCAYNLTNTQGEALYRPATPQ